MLGLSGSEVIVIVIAILIIFGPKKIPELAKSFADVLRTFRNATDDIKREVWSAGRGVENPIEELKDEFSNFGDQLTKEVKDVGQQANDAAIEVNKQAETDDKEDEIGPISR